MPTPPESPIKTTKPLISKWLKHRADWSSCTRCPIGRTCTSHVLGRGHLPCDILFIGEAPGRSEDITGVPFIGPAGKVLDTLITNSVAYLHPTKIPVGHARRHYTYAITNIIACLPQRSNDPTSTVPSIGQPSDKEALTCRPRLLEFVSLARPRGIVLLGAVAKQHFPVDPVGRYDKPAVLTLVHPAYILRTGGARQSNPNYTTALSRLVSWLESTLK